MSCGIALTNNKGITVKPDWSKSQSIATVGTTSEEHKNIYYKLVRSLSVIDYVSPMEQVTHIHTVINLSIYH